VTAANNTTISGRALARPGLFEHLLASADMALVVNGPVSAGDAFKPKKEPPSPTGNAGGITTGSPMSNERRNVSEVRICMSECFILGV
jgi:hypothetical protein